MKHFKPARYIPVTEDCDQWLVFGPEIDSYVTKSEQDAREFVAEFCFGYGFTVIRFNAAEPETTRNVTLDFIPDDEDSPEFVGWDRAASAGDSLHQQRREGV